MDVGEAGHRGGGVAGLGVVLHRARPERVGAEVDGVLAVGEAGEVGDEVPLGHLGQLHGSRERNCSGTSSSAVHSGSPLVRNEAERRPGWHLEQGRLGRPPHHRCALGAASGVRAIIARPCRGLPRRRRSAARPPLGRRRGARVRGAHEAPSTTSRPRSPPRPDARSTAPPRSQCAGRTPAARARRPPPLTPSRPRTASRVYRVARASAVATSSSPVVPASRAGWQRSRP